MATRGEMPVSGEMPVKKVDARDCNLLLDELAAMLGCAAVRKVQNLHKAAEDLTCTQADQAENSRRLQRSLYRPSSSRRATIAIRSLNRAPKF